MILIDYNGIALAAIFVQHVEIQEDIIRHMILNSIRMHRKRFGKKYGEIVLCCDHGSWRKEVYPQYKANRALNKKEDDNDWEKIFSILNTVKDEIKENFPYKVIDIEKCEADDIIGALVRDTQEFGRNEPVMIVSNDKDFVQLQKFSNVKQFAPVKGKFMTEKDPHGFMFEHICRGDKGDGVPNILSADDSLVNNVRQTPLSQKKIDTWRISTMIVREMGEETYRNYQRNKKMIDLSETPSVLVKEIINTYDDQTVAKKSAVMPFLVKKRCRNLLESLGDFIN